MAEDNVRVAHLVGGHVIIGIPGTPWTDVLTMQLGIGQGGKQVLQYGAAAVFGDDLSCDMNEDLIMFSYKPDQHIRKTYKSNLSQIAAAKAGIITPNVGNKPGGGLIL